MVVLGRIVAPYGVAGWVHIHPFGDDPDAWRSMAQWWLARDAEGTEWQPYRLLGFKAHGDSWVARFEEVADRAGAEALKGMYLAAPREALPQPAENEYYWADLIGLAVINEADESLGTVESLIETGANHVLVVRDGEQQRLLPYVDQVVKEVSLAERRIKVDWGLDW
ncbi:MAG TPA: ribosome maturation factor RimM [Rhodocyclaceae bacterium]